MVLVDERAVSRRALRRGAMLATALSASLTAAVVETPSFQRLSFDHTRDLQEHLDYAADLGAEIVRLPGRDLVTGLVELAREHRVSHLVLGRDVHRGLAQRLAPDITDRLLAALPELELHLVAG